MEHVKLAQITSLLTQILMEEDALELLVQETQFSTEMELAKIAVHTEDQHKTD
jgi:hypothetical protein